MQRRILILVKFAAIVLILFLNGCNDKFWDPTQIGRFKPVPAVNVILDSLGVADEKPTEWAGAEDPKPVDIMVFENDYAFASGDTIQITIFELLQQGENYFNQFIVTETGKISIPEVGVVEVAGLTESQLEEEIKRILSPTILKTPIVSVVSVASQKRTFSIMGQSQSVPRAGRYPIPRYDFRLKDALATAGAQTQYNASYIYVARAVSERDLGYGPYRSTQFQQKEQSPPDVPEDEMLEIIAPTASARRPGSQLVVTTAEFATDELTDIAKPYGTREKSLVLATTERVAAGQEQQFFRDSIETPIENQSQSKIEWVFRDGKWVPVSVGPVIPKKKIEQERFEQPAYAQRQQEIPEEFDWDQIGTGGVQTRVIKIPSDKLSGGDPRYNIIIRPGDNIHVPLDVIGEFAIMGNINAQGYIPLTGRKMTLKMAVAAAGGLGQLAWPKRCEVTRRIGANKEETVMVDLDKIASGEEPDFYIKPNDLVNIGTHPTSRFRAILRNSFRATYGFGFLYDRNFADREFGLRHPLSPFGF
ncbi:MAG: polysaccharide biosynthesis/export family protein [Sedimentisphaerales bacterium]|nr:polysaccharide biosynthesis/export family protein [Sedimentisphaerales bacterium]